MIICAAKAYGEVDVYQTEEVVFTYLPANHPV
jgi:hypothetical protein